MDRQIIEFLIRAKQATYAGKGAETAPSRVKSHDLVFRDGEYMYYDTYLGGEKFAGEEALWIQDVPYWSMNYAGRVTGEPFSGCRRTSLTADRGNTRTGIMYTAVKPRGTLTGSRGRKPSITGANRSMNVIITAD